MTKLSEVERIKTKSNYLRGDLKKELKNQLTGSVSNDEQQLIKFHGIYQQDDRDRRKERALKKHEKAYSFMLRLRIPAGKITAQQFSNIFDVTETHGTGIVKITTRQTVQLHGVIKFHLKPTLQWFDQFNLDAIAACGDVNRNVIASNNYLADGIREEVIDISTKISKKFLPQSNAYKEVWLDGEKIIQDSDKDEVIEPIYGKTYLPRKFKIALAVPPYNDADVLANDIGIIAIIEKGKLVGFNVAAGGGMGRTHGNEATYPRVADIIGYVTKDKIFVVMEEILKFQRDHGNRSDRKLSRLKYTIDNFGLEKFVNYLQEKLGFKLEKAKEIKFIQRNDNLGWEQESLGNYLYTIFVENGRIIDSESCKIKTALKEIIALEKSEFQFTANQNVAITNVKAKDKKLIDDILSKYGINSYQQGLSAIRQNSMACVALNTCPLALAEAQRYLPDLLVKLESLLNKYQLQDDGIVTRMTGCPNGCARPYLAEIGFVGTSLGRYDLHLGGDRLGFRLNKIYKKSLNEAEILTVLDGLFADYAKQRKEDQTFGDFTQNLDFLN
jgi:sulfite reductase (NADPH) hemoprotein beta-component